MKFSLIIRIAVFSVFLGICACSSLIPEEESNKLKLLYQSGEYTLLEKIKQGDVTLEKNSAVRLVVVPGDDWLKIYAFDADEDLLHSKRVLILYLFESDFPNSKYSREFFNNELDKKVRQK